MTHNSVKHLQQENRLRWELKNSGIIHRYNFFFILIELLILLENNHVLLYCTEVIKMSHGYIVPPS